MLGDLGVKYEVLEEPLAIDGQGGGFGIRIKVESHREFYDVMKVNWARFRPLLSKFLVIDVVAEHADEEFLPDRSHKIDHDTLPAISMPFHLDFGHGHLLDPVTWSHSEGVLYQQPTLCGRDAPTLFAKPDDVAAEIARVVNDKVGLATLLFRCKKNKTDSSIMQVMRWRSLEQNFVSNFGFRNPNDQILENMLNRSVRIDWADIRYCANGRLVYFWNGDSWGREPRVVHTRYGRPEDCKKAALWSRQLGSVRL